MLHLQKQHLLGWTYRAFHQIDIGMVAWFFPLTLHTRHTRTLNIAKPSLILARPIRGDQRGFARGDVVFFSLGALI